MLIAINFRKIFFPTKCLQHAILYFVLQPPIYSILQVSDLIVNISIFSKSKVFLIIQEHIKKKCKAETISNLVG